MALQYSPKIVTDNLVMCLDASQNKSYPTTDLPVKGGLVMWLDAADDTTFSYSSGTVVSQWRDKSGLNNHVAQSTVANQPSRSSTKNSRKTVVFDGSNDNLFNSGNVFPSNTADYTKIAVVFQTSTGSTGNVISSKTGTAGSNFGHAFYFGNSTSIRLWHDTDFVVSNVALNTNTLGIISGTYVNSSGSGALYVNGTAAGTGTAANRNIVRDIQIGGIVDCCFFTGEICEVLVFSRVLSATELKQVHTYLGQKWGISNTDRSIVDLSNNNIASFGGAAGSQTVANMPTFDFYNKGSLSFDGSNDYITIPSSASIKNTSSLTLEAWIYISNSMNYYGGIFGKGTTDADEEYCLLVHSVNSKVYMDVGSGGGPYTDATFSFSLNTWYHIIGTHERAAGSSAIKIYVNGSLLSSSTVNPTNAVNDNSTAVTIGSRFSTGGSHWNGKIANAKIYTRTLSATEVAQNYEAQKSKFANTIVQQGLVLNLDAGNPYSYAGAGTTFYDVSNTALSWTTNNTTYNSDPIKYFSYNGSSSWLQSSTSAAYDSQTITMECWFYPTTLTQDGFLFEKGQVNTQYSMFLAFGNTFYFRTIGGTINNQDLTFTTSTYITANIWNHVVCTYNGSTKIVYVNGIQAASVAASGTLQTGQTNQYIGKYGAAGNNFPFNGRIAESRVYNIALSAAQVLQNYNATKGRFGL